MFKVKEIVLTRAEGPSHLCDRPTKAGSFAHANAILFQWATTAPKDGGYDKCDFTISYETEDGEEGKYGGRYDLVHYTKEHPNLLGHVMAFAGCVSGKKKPVHLSDKDYEHYLSAMSDEEREGFGMIYEGFKGAA